MDEMGTDVCLGVIEGFIWALHGFTRLQGRLGFRTGLRDSEGV